MKRPKPKHALTEIQRDEKMKAILDRIPRQWEKSLPNVGWDDLLLNLDRILAEIDPDYVIYQAKEKFGTLRFYANGNGISQSTDDLGYLYINAFENMSAHICENCGETEGVCARPSGWVRTLCTRCWEQK